MSLISANAASLEREVAWFSKVLESRINLYFEQPCDWSDIYQLSPPDLADDGSEYAGLVKRYALAFDERIVLILALIPHLRPQALDLLFIRNKNLERGYTEFGGWKGRSHSGFLPTCETAAFILAGSDLEKRLAIIRLFESNDPLISNGIIKIEHQGGGEPFFSGTLMISNEYLNLCTSGVRQLPDYSTTFPAKRISTKLQWHDLVLSSSVLHEVENVTAWIKHSATIMETWGLAKNIKPGYRALFYGPPGTGKTLTATLIGSAVAADVYRIDLSMVVSKYIGETEKNLANVFDQAQNRNWILFFDEADALFGKRTQTSSSNDRYANQEVSYLLQRVEDFPGVVILATNLKANIDEAFARRFQSLVYFAMPDAEQRLLLWQGALNDSSRLADDVDLKSLSERYELSGGAITNVVRYGAINALKLDRQTICQMDLVSGIAKELRKEGKTI